MRKVALDLGTRKTAYCEVRDGKVVLRGTEDSVQKFEAQLGPDQPAAVVAIEACREAWYVHDLLKSWGNEVVLVDTTRSRRLGIGQHGRKTDRIDAEVLALALERGGIPAAHVLSPHRRELRRWLGVRRALVESQAQIVTTARGIAREYGSPLPRCTVDRFVKNVRKLDGDPQLGAAIEPLLKMLETIAAELVGVEQAIAKLCATEPVVTLLATAPGVGPIVAASFVSVIDDAKRFTSAHHVQSYLGLVPSEDSSGGKRRLGAITKKGNKYMRALLVQSAWTILRKTDANDPLKLWAQAVAARRGKQVAVIALARRLVGVLWAMWKNGNVYEAPRLAVASSRGLTEAAQSIEFRAEALRKASKKESMKRFTVTVTPT
jgi:transposase